MEPCERFVMKVAERDYIMAAIVGHRRGGEGCGNCDDGSNEDCMFN